MAMLLDLSVFSKLADVSVLVVGDVMLDKYLSGETERISPEAPIPVVKVKTDVSRLGGAANVARNVATLGARVGLLGVVGDDESGQSLMAEASNLDIDLHLIQQADLPTTTKLRVLSRGQQVLRLDFEETLAEKWAKKVSSGFDDIIENYQCVIFSDYDKGALQFIREMIESARSRGKLVLVDPKKRDFRFYQGANVITPNKEEFQNAGGELECEDKIFGSAKAIIKNSGIDSILLTRSEQGMSFISEGEKVDLKAVVHEVSDVTGAGDTVIATLGVMLSAGLDREQAAYMANMAASISVSRVGAVAVTALDLADRCVSHQEKHSDQWDSESIDSVMQRIRFAKARGEKIVFTNGCFDILHAGHISYLTKAKQLGHRLVLGLNTDASISRLKGSDRPINNLVNRKMVLSGLRCVDWIISFGDSSDDTPLNLIKEIKPDILVKGGDYSKEQVVGADFVESYGGEVAIVDLVEGLSTTNLITKITS